MDLKTAQVVRAAPAKPDDSSEFTWSWSEEFGRWLAEPTVMRARADKLAAIDQAIVRAEGGTDRALRELVLSSALPAPARARFLAIEDAVAKLRDLRARAISASTHEEIDALRLP